MACTTGFTHFSAKTERAMLAAANPDGYNPICVTTKRIMANGRATHSGFLDRTRRLVGDDRRLGRGREELRKAAKIGGKYGEKPGPLKTAVTEGQFDQVHLLSKLSRCVHKPFAYGLAASPSFIQSSWPIPRTTMGYSAVPIAFLVSSPRRSLVREE